MLRIYKNTAVIGATLVIVSLPILGHLARQKKENCCALDGVAIEPIYRVRIVDRQNQSYEFCCAKCAQLWMEAHDSSYLTVFVTDETSGHDIPAGWASFTTSSVVTIPTTGNRIHAFADERDAQSHAEIFRGRVLTGKERPFHELE
jgi:hypothetical protein